MPARIPDLDHLEDLLSTPTDGVIDTCRRLQGDVIVLGIGGKMGPSLARMIRRASDLAGVKRRVIGVSRFGGSSVLQKQLTEWGIEPIACDLLDQPSLDRLPDAPNVVYMPGMKFGTSSGQAALTWAMNSYLPGMVCNRFRQSRIVAFSTGNVYALVPVTGGGATEDGDVTPVGEYGMSALGRERIFEHFSRTLNIPLAIIRLNYAVEMRYGVLVDLATKVWKEQDIDLSMGAFNVIWQADASAHTIQAFDQVSSPPRVLNVTGPETLSVRATCHALGHLMGKTPRFIGQESDTALLNNAQVSHGLFGYPRVPVRQLLQWTAEWVKQGGATLSKPTHFQTRDGKF